MTSFSANDSIQTRIAWMTDEQASELDLNIDGAFDSLKEILGLDRYIIEPVRTITHGAQAESRAGVDPFSNLNEHDLNKLSVLPQKTFIWKGVSEGEICHYLSCYAQLSHADLIMISHHWLRKHLPWMRSSFLATLARDSRVPVCVSIGNHRRTRKFGRILFPVTHPEICVHGFEDVLKLAQVSNSKIIILYKRPQHMGAHSWDPAETINFGSVPFYEPAFLMGENERLKLISSWINEARKQGVSVDLVINRSPLGLSKSVLEYQKELACDLVAIDCNCLLNSSFEQNFEAFASHIKCPIWIPHPIKQNQSSTLLQKARTRLLGGRTGLIR